MNQNPPFHPHSIAIVGAGPGDPELLTLKAMRHIEQAQVILFDHLVSAEIQALFPPHAEAIYVGKRRRNHSYSQSQIEQLMIQRAHLGQRVLRLKGGDPFVFGRGSEELLSLRQAGLDADVIPGITAASGCGSAFAIPLTHRGLSQGCTFITGHGQDDQPLDWRFLAQAQHTLVFYMGLGALDQIRAQLCCHGMVEDTPVALIENGCRPNQRLIRTTLGKMSADAVKHQLQSPTLTYIGAVTTVIPQPITASLLAKESA
ncbi:MAG: uroporphyrinogen-III C-methyltransferase [Ferrimonas sp.]